MFVINTEVNGRVEQKGEAVLAQKKREVEEKLKEVKDER